MKRIEEWTDSSNPVAKPVMQKNISSKIKFYCFDFESLAFQPKCFMVVVKRLQQAVQMGRGRHDNKYMKDLMGTSPDVERAWP